MYAGGKPKEGVYSQNAEAILGKGEVGEVQLGRQASEASLPYWPE